MPSISLAWAAAVVGWDGMLPLLVLLTPRMINWAFPNGFWPQFFAVVLLPIGAFIIRSIFGFRAIAANHCGERLRRNQGSAFVLALAMLFALDATTVIVQIQRDPRAIPNFIDPFTALAIGVPVYLMLMSFAMYPGRNSNRPVPDG